MANFTVPSYDPKTPEYKMIYPVDALRNLLSAAEIRDFKDYRKAKLEHYNKGRNMLTGEGEEERNEVGEAEQKRLTSRSVSPSSDDPLGILSHKTGRVLGETGDRGDTAPVRGEVVDDFSDISAKTGEGGERVGEAGAVLGVVDSSMVDPDQRGITVRNKNGTFSSERTATIEQDGVYYNIPTLINGEQLTLEEAKRKFVERETKATGAYRTQEEAVRAARKRSAEFGVEMMQKLSGKKPLTMGDIKWIEESQDREMRRAEALGKLIKTVGGLRRFKQLQKGLAAKFPGLGIEAINTDEVKDTGEGGYIQKIKGPDGKPSGWSVVYYENPETGVEKAELKRDMEPQERAIQDDHKFDAIQLKREMNEPLTVEERAFEKSYTSRKTMGPMAGYGFAPGSAGPAPFSKWDPSQKEVWFKKYDSTGNKMELPFDYRDRASWESFGREYADWKRKQAGPEGGEGKLNYEKVGDAIMSGKQPPELGNMGRMGAQIRQYMADKEYSLTQAVEDWTATKKHIGTMNGAQQVRLRQAVAFTRDSLDIVEDLAKEWKAGRFAALNRIQIEAAKQGAFGKDAASLATRLDGQIADLVSELAVVYRGGNTSTDASLKLASNNLKAQWDEKVLIDNIGLVRKNLKIRENSIRGTRPIGKRGGGEDGYANQDMNIKVGIKTPLDEIERAVRNAGESEDPKAAAIKIKREAVIDAYKRAGTTGESDENIIKDYNSVYGSKHGRL